MPQVSVVIPALNRGEILSRAVQSVLDQSYQDFEILVVDDGSTDDTLQVVADLTARDERVRCIRHDSNRGAQAARNTGIRAALGQWVAFLDSDDYWLSDSLELRLQVAKQQKSEVVHSECYVIKQDGLQTLFGVKPFSGQAYLRLLASPGPLFPALLVTKRVLENIGYLDEKIISWQEWDTCIRLAKHCSFGFTAEPTFVYDCRSSNTISKQVRRDALGYEQVISKHKWAILLHLGLPALALHYQYAASRYQRSGDKRSAVRCRMLSRLLWPFRLKGMRRLRRLLLQT